MSVDLMRVRVHDATTGDQLAQFFVPSGFPPLEPGEEATEAVLEGETLDRRRIRGIDSVRIDP